MGDISDYKNKEKLRREYSGPQLNKSDAADNPIDQFDKWFKEALDDDLTDANAMTLATATNHGKPSARIVLLKGVDEQGFRFYTNYRSRKGQELEANPQSALCFYWAELNRQIRVEGQVKRASVEVSAEYFSKRPRKSQLSAHASKQSSIVSSRKALENDFEKTKKQFEDKQVARPEHWGGYILDPSVIEFWQGRPGRLHDRIVYTKKGSSWNISRLAP